MISPDELQTYFAKARRFDEDRLEAARRSSRLAWRISAVCVLLTAFSVLAVAALAPLKSVEPFVVRVDQTTGIVDVATALRDEPQDIDLAVTRYFAGIYVRAREGYVRSLAEHDYHTVQLLSAPGEQQRHAALFRGSNPNSPQNLYRGDTRADIMIKSMSLISPKVLSVRFSKTVRSQAHSEVSHFVATLTFDYVNAAMSQADRLINPLGFQVSDYRADPEVTP